jgi:ABC-2 type transport system ATP-binding protein
LLRIEHAHKRFGDICALRDVNLQAGAGRVLGLLGPNGSGKTTAMRAVFDLVNLDRGQVTWQGRPIGRRQLQRFGYMPENRGLYPRAKVREQLIYLGRLRGMDRDSAAAAADTWLERLGLADRSETPLENLSNGNQQRIQLAAALLHDPELLVLDEPFAGLDPLATQTLSELVRERAAAGSAVIFSSHQLDLVQELVDDVAIVDAGRLLRFGPVDQIRSGSAYRRLRVELAEPAARWWGSLAGAELVTADDCSVSLRVDSDLDLNTALDAALRAGGVIEFAYTRPSLSEVFLEAVRGREPDGD